MEWIDVIRNLGFPTAICLAVGMGIWRACAWLGPRLEVWVNRLVSSHEALSQSCITIGQSNSETLKKLEVICAAQTTAMHRVETVLAKLTGSQPPNHP